MSGDKLMQFGVLAAVLLALSTFLGSSAFGQQPRAGERPLVVVFDSSGSMATSLSSGVSRSSAAKQATQQLLSDVSSSQPISVLVFGGLETPNQCEVGAPIAVNPAQLQAAQQNISTSSPLGKSPLVASLESAIASLNRDGGDIVLVTDGFDTCGRNICELSRRIPPNVSIRVSTFGASPEARDELGCLDARLLEEHRSTSPQVSPPPKPIGFWDTPPDLTAWSLANSNLPVAVLGAILTVVFGLIFKSQEDRNKTLGKQNEKLGEEKDAANEAAQGAQSALNDVQDEDFEAEVEEQVVLVRNAPDTPNYRENARQLVDQARTRLNSLANNADGRHKKTYEKIERYDYTVLAAAMRKRGDLSDTQYNAALRMFQLWKRIAKGRAALRAVPELVLGYVQKQASAIEAKK